MFRVSKYHGVAIVIINNIYLNVSQSRYLILLGKTYVITYYRRSYLELFKNCFETSF